MVACRSARIFKVILYNVRVQGQPGYMRPCQLIHVNKYINIKNGKKKNYNPQSKDLKNRKIERPILQQSFKLELQTEITQTFERVISVVKTQPCRVCFLLLSRSEHLNSASSLPANHGLWGSDEREGVWEEEGDSMGFLY